MEPEHAVLVNVPVPGGEAGWELVSKLSDRLAERIDEAGVGEFDGNEIGEGWARFYCYGPDADRLWDAVADTVDLGSLPPGAHAVKRYGAPGAPSVRIEP